MSSVLAGGRVVLPEQVLDPGWVEVADRRVVATGAGAPPAGAVGVRDLGGGWLVPGYIDLHMHGGGGHSVLSSAADMAAAVAFHHQHGTVRTLVSAVTAPVEAMCDVAAWGAELVARGRTPAGTVVGSHLEGPFLSALRCGAQDPAALLAPDPGVLRRLLAAGRGRVRVVTLAPELPGALELVALLATEGVVAAVGHTDATYRQTARALGAGARLLTHAFNGMPGIGHRAPGPVPAAMDDDRVVGELINDGEHVQAPAARLLFRGLPGRVALITDAIAAAGAGDGEYLLGRLPVLVRGGLARLADGGAIAGSTLTMDAAVRRAVREVGLPVPAAVAAASQVPADLLGLWCGRIAPGYAADLLVLDDDLAVREVLA